jgi:hypothetical protein
MMTSCVNLFTSKHLLTADKTVRKKQMTAVPQGKSNGSRNKTYPTMMKHQQQLRIIVYYNATIKLIDANLNSIYIYIYTRG